MLVLAYRLKTGCKQYAFENIEGLEKFCSRKPYKDEYLRLMIFNETGYRLTDEWIAAKDAAAWTRKIIET